jgi:hypothetical protein
MVRWRQRVAPARLETDGPAAGATKKEGVRPLASRVKSNKGAVARGLTPILGFFGSQQQHRRRRRLPRNGDTADPAAALPCLRGGSEPAAELVTGFGRPEAQHLAHLALVRRSILVRSHSGLSSVTAHGEAHPVDG